MATASVVQADGKCPSGMSGRSMRSGGVFDGDATKDRALKRVIHMRHAAKSTQQFWVAPPETRIGRKQPMQPTRCVQRASTFLSISPLRVSAHVRHTRRARSAHPSTLRFAQGALSLLDAGASYRVSVSSPRSLAVSNLRPVKLAACARHRQCLQSRLLRNPNCHAPPLRSAHSRAAAAGRPPQAKDTRHPSES